jgi:lysophospholipase L1-like esterase
MASTIPSRRISFKRRLAYISIIYLVFLVFLVAIEIGTRLTMDHVYSLDLFVVTPQQKAQVAEGKQSAIFEGDPLLMWRLKPNLHQAYWDFTTVSTNAQHLRHDRPLQAKEPGTFRIISIGDSVTFGYRVPPVWPDKPKDFNPDWVPYPTLLERTLRQANPARKIEVITMAVPGYTSHQGLAWLRRDIDKLQPDLVTISFGWNDASFSDVPDREAIRTDWYVVATRWMIVHSQAFAHVTKWLRAKQSPGNAIKRPVPRVSQQEYVNNFRRMIGIARARGAGVVVIGAPYRDRTTNPPEAELMGAYRASLRSFAQDYGISYLEVLELTEAAHESNQGWFGELIHPNHMGHRLMASELLKFMRSNRMLGDITVPDLVP